MCGVLIICAYRVFKKAKETSIIGKSVRSFNFLYRQSLQKGKRNFGNWFVQILYFHQRSGFPLLFVYFPLSVSARSACFINRRRQSGGTGFAGLRSKPSRARQEGQRDPSPTLLVFFEEGKFSCFFPVSAGTKAPHYQKHFKIRAALPPLLW